jgi:predicted PurR-regulated permease PerM
MPSVTDRIRSKGADLSQSVPEMIPGWLMTFGIAGWLIVGVAAALSLAAWLFVYSASISIPLLLAMVVGMIAYPLCERMTARGVPKSAAAGIVLVLLFVIIGGVVWITLVGVISQWPAIQAQLEAGVAAIGAQLQAAGVNTDAIQAAMQSARDAATTQGAAGNPLVSGLLSSIGSALTSGLSSIFAMLFGVFIGATLLFYVLTDFPNISTWIGGHMGRLPVDVGEGIVEDAVGAMRGYFRATTITGFAVAAVIGAAMLLMGVPLAVTVALVTFLTCYIPYFGAIISGAFAFLVALGSNGLTAALILLVVVLVTQNVLQTLINARVMGTSLNLHPLVVLVVTMLGGIFAGLLGAALAAPIAALLISAGKRLSEAFGPDAEVPAASGGQSPEPRMGT